MLPFLRYSLIMHLCMIPMLLHACIVLVHTVCDFIMLTFRSYRTNGTTDFFKTMEKRTLLLSNGNNRRTLCFQTIQRANSMATRVLLRSFQSFTNASVVSPVSDGSIAYDIVTFCNPSDAVRKMGIVERCVQRCVQRSNRSIKTD